MLDEALKEIGAAADARQLQDLRVTYLGKKGRLTSQLKSLGAMAPEERREAGARINAMRVVLSKFEYTDKDHEVVGQPDPLIVQRGRDQEEEPDRGREEERRDHGCGRNAAGMEQGSQGLALARWM